MENKSENKSISSDLIRGHIDTIILYSLTDGDKHAQQISDSIEQKSNNEYQINQATLYSSLKRLESLKYVSPYWHNAETGRRRYFKLTDKGKKIVENNLENWSHSRSIIDKLINCEPQNVNNSEPIIQTVYVEKPVEVVVEKVVEKTVEKEKIINEALPASNFNEKEKPLSDGIPEKNFRSVLNDLIRQTEKPKQEITELSPIVKEKDEIKENENSVAKFNETIREDVKKETEKSNQIDFSDIVKKGESEGYKVSVSSKNKAIKFGSLYINKVRIISAFTVFLIALIEFLTVNLIFKSTLNLSALKYLIIFAIIFIYPVICLVLYLKKPLKTSKTVNKDSILTCSIIIFNLALFTVVANLLLETDFTSVLNVISYLVFPIFIYVDALLYFVFRYVFAQGKIFKNVRVKNK